MGDQDRLGQPGFDRRRRVADMDHEAAPADSGAVDPGRRDAQVVRELHRGLLRGTGDTVDVRRLQAAIGHGVQRGIGMQAKLRQFRDNAQARGFRGTDNGDCIMGHGISLSRDGTTAA